MTITASVATAGSRSAGGQSAAIRALQAQAEHVLSGMFASFTTASTTERLEMLTSFGQYSLQHQAHLAQFARVVETAPSELSSAAKDLHYRSTAELLQHEVGYGKGMADTLTRLGKLLEKQEYPTLAAAVAEGVVSNQQAGVIIRLLDDWRGSVTDEFLMRAEAAATDWARGDELHEAMKPEQLQKLLRNWHKKEHPETVELTAEELFEKRRASLGVQRDGMIKATVVMTPDQGAAMLAFTEACASPRAGAGAFGDAEGDFRTKEQKLADAFASAFMIAGKAKEAPTQAGSAPTLMMLTTLEDMQRYAEGLPGIATVSRTSEIVPVAEAALIACHGAIQAAATDKNGHILQLGRSTRLFNAAQRRALNIEYPECATSGCDIPAAWCESHHIRWWSRGGTTDTVNGVNLCNYHHHQVHMGHFELQQDSQTHRWKAVRVIRR